MSIRPRGPGRFGRKPRDVHSQPRIAQEGAILATIWPSVFGAYLGCGRMRGQMAPPNPLHNALPKPPAGENKKRWEAQGGLR